ncbi:MAG: hypothetical protein OEY63_02695, partial [Gemmatimonadota bacterium]|nr:hypothetical protein [Gemmatimonadota bacterium]
VTALSNRFGSRLLGRTSIKAVAGVATFDSVYFNRAGTDIPLLATAESGVVLSQQQVVDVELLFSSIQAGGNIVCGLTPLHDAYCWGRNSLGALGVGISNGNVGSPTLVVGDISFSQLSVGAEWYDLYVQMTDGYVCGVSLDRVAYCWGNNQYGQLGNGVAGDPVASPRPVSGSYSFRKVEAGPQHACGLTVSGQVLCWGSNDRGQLGNGQVGVNMYVPTPVLGTRVYVDLFVGSRGTSCATDVAGLLYCWVSVNAEKDVVVDVPTLVDADIGFAQVDPGSWQHLCGVGLDGVGYCWGYGENFVLGGENPAVEFQPAPMPVVGTVPWKTITTGYTSSCGLRVDSVAMCWGADGSGQLGTGYFNRGYYFPVPVVGDLKFDSLVSGRVTTCGLTSSRKAYCWGWGRWGEHGDGQFTAERAVPGPVGNPQ